MGYGLITKCKKCKYKEEFLLGVGMMFPRVYQRIVEEVRSGKYGEEWRVFFERR